MSKPQLSLYTKVLNPFIASLKLPQIIKNLEILENL